MENETISGIITAWKLYCKGIIIETWENFMPFFIELDKLYDNHLNPSIILQRIKMQIDLEFYKKSLSGGR